MDWIDVQIETAKKKVQDMPLLKAAVCYFFFFAGIAALLAFLTIRICDRRIIMWQEGSLELKTWEIQGLLFLAHWCSFGYLAAAMAAMLGLFYKNRLKKPLGILHRSVEEIQRQNLQFSLVYDSRDEMGGLCRALETMRNGLIEQYEQLWRQIDRQKQLNAAFAHDLRTPLTVLKGYSEFLVRYLPEGKVSQEKMRDILVLMSRQLERLTAFSKTMKEVQSLEQYPVERELLELSSLYETVRGIAEALNLGGAVRLFLQEPSFGQEKGKVDEKIVLEVLDNLLSNAIRFADSAIYISMEICREKENRYLLLYVEDNGAGFTESGLAKAVQPYYGEKREDEHFGIGLHICSMLCKAHGGVFSIANRMEEQGAVASASFLIS